MSRSRIAVLGFLPWTDLERGTNVIENPAALAAERCAGALATEGRSASFVPVPVSGDGISAALEAVRQMDAEIAVALGQTSREPRVERYARVPGGWPGAIGIEEGSWLLAPDAEDLAQALNVFHDPASDLLPFRASDDAGGYYCDHLCVELARESQRRAFRARFLHVTAIDGCPPAVREARLRQYARQARVAVDWLLGLPV